MKKTRHLEAGAKLFQIHFEALHIALTMGVRLAAVFRAKEMLQQSLKSNRSSSFASEVPKKGYFTVYVGEMEKRFVIPISYLEDPMFQSLLHKAEEEYGFEHPEGLLRVPCNEDTFIDITSQIMC